MIRLIGFKKIFMILLLVFLLVICLFYMYAMASPDIKASKKELNQNTSEISELSQNIDQLKLGIEQFQSQESEFKDLEKHDMFNTQDRVQTRRKLNSIREASGVSSAQYTIKPALSDKSEKLQDAGYKILNTPMQFSIEAIEDQNIYQFIYLLNYGFPGQITLEEVSITREEEVTFSVLKQIGIGKEPLRPLVKAEIKASWRTIVPDTTIAVTGGDE